MSIDIRKREELERLIGAVRKAAYGCGYCIAEHGSMGRDIDLVAIPWTDEAQYPATLVADVTEAVRAVNGEAFVYNDGECPYRYDRKNPEPKPHGRLAWAIYLQDGRGSYIDLSVMPLANKQSPTEENHDA